MDSGESLLTVCLRQPFYRELGLYRRNVQAAKKLIDIFEDK